MERKLSNEFIDDLLNGYLKELLEYVKSDNTLDIEIRSNCINIYYRGGNAIKVTEKSVHKYDLYFDFNYLKVASFLSKKEINSFKDSFEWNKYFPLVKQAMDFFITRDGKEEREYQQLVVRENNYSSIANSTDYFIVDIEYDNRDNARFDIVAIEWESDASKRKLSKKYEPKLVIIEMKYGDGALKGIAGMQKHIDDFTRFVSSISAVSDFKKEMIEVFRQKRLLGLVPCLSNKKNSNIITSFANEVEMMFLLGGHDPAKSVLKKELTTLKNPEIKFITSNFFGYSLYKENVFNLNDFTKRFLAQI